MNTNEEEKDIIDQDNNENTGEGEGEVENQDNKQPERPQETPEAKRARLKRQLEQLDKKYPVVEEKKNESGKKSDDLDYGQKAFLIANGVKGSKETELVKTIMNNTGKSLDEVLESKYFQAELKDLRDAELAAAATPSGSNRNGQSASTTVEYWIAKGELPPASERELRQKVVNARLANEKNTNVFTNTPVAGK